MALARSLGTEIELTTFYRALFDDLYRFTLSLSVPTLWSVPTRVSRDLQLTWSEKTVSSSYLPVK